MGAPQRLADEAGTRPRTRATAPVCHRRKGASFQRPGQGACLVTPSSHLFSQCPSCVGRASNRAPAVPSQINAVSLYLLYLVEMTSSGLQIIYNTDEVGRPRAPPRCASGGVWGACFLKPFISFTKSGVFCSSHNQILDLGYWIKKSLCFSTRSTLERNTQAADYRMVLLGGLCSRRSETTHFWKF